MKGEFYILLKNIRIQAANTISSPITYGFPSVGGFVGAIHALNRSLPENIPLSFNGVLIACSQCLPHIFREHPFADASLIQTRNPVGKDGKTAAIIEEGKVDLTVSLVIKASTDKPNAIKNYIADVENQIQNLLMKQRIAGGSVMKIGKVRIFNQSGTMLNKEDDPSAHRPLIQHLMPAYILTDASDELPAIIEELKPHTPQATALDALIATAQLLHIPPTDENEQWQHHSIKTGRGWLVPMPVGYQAISDEISNLKNSRNPEYTARFVESIYSLGKWVFPLSCQDNWQQHFWFFRQPENHNGNMLYRYATGENSNAIDEQTDEF